MPKSLSKYQQRLYDRWHEEEANSLRAVADLFVSDVIGQDQFKEAMLDSLKQYYIRLALTAKGRALTPRDKSDLGILLAQQNDFLVGFMQDAQEYKTGGFEPTEHFATPAGLIGRAAKYANAWTVYSRYSIPASLADLLPGLPGVDCLGGALCGCFLVWAVAGDAVEVYWEINHFKEHCVLCADFNLTWSPYVVLFSEMDPDVVSEDEDFYYD